MDTLTRRQALDYAYVTYVDLRNRALAAIASEDREYAIELSAAWEAELRRLSRLGSSILVSDEVVGALHRLAKRASAEHADLDTWLDWLDAFPEAVAELFPPSASTFRLEGARAPARRARHLERALAA